MAGNYQFYVSKELEDLNLEKIVILQFVTWVENEDSV